MIQIPTKEHLQSINLEYIARIYKAKHNKKVKLKVFRNICEDFFTLSFHLMMFYSLKLNLGSYLGNFHIRLKPMHYNKLQNMKIDYKATYANLRAHGIDAVKIKNYKEYWVYHTNEHSNSTYCEFKWQRGKLKNVSYYTFELSRANSREMSSNQKENKLRVRS